MARCRWFLIQKAERCQNEEAANSQEEKRGGKHTSFLLLKVISGRRCRSCTFDFRAAVRLVCWIGQTTWLGLFDVVNAAPSGAGDLLLHHDRTSFFFHDGR
jgi:hypothetical protein